LANRGDVISWNMEVSSVSCDFVSF